MKTKSAFFFSAASAATVFAILFVSASNRAPAQPGVTSEMPKILRGHDAGVTGLAFFPGGNRLASSSLDHTVRVWDIAVGKVIKTFCSHTDEVFAVAVTANGRFIVSTGYDRKVIVNDAAGDVGRELPGMEGWSVGVAVSADSRFAAAWGMDGGIRIWEIATGRLVRTFTGEKEKWGVSLAWAPDGKTLAAGRAAITLWFFSKRVYVTGF